MGSVSQPPPGDTETQTAGEGHGATFLANPLAGPLESLPAPSPDIASFHRRLPGYRPTPLVRALRLGSDLGVGELLVKCESERFGLPAFKMLGASWATYRALCEHVGEEPGPWEDVEELARLLKGVLPFRLAAATDGNHGRAVARMARWLGFDARIFVPEGTTPGRIDAIASEGADVTVVAGDYDDAVRRSAEEAGARCLVISDTSWPGYEDVPRWVIDGYSTLFAEIGQALDVSGAQHPDAAFVPLGVGALGAAAANFFRTGDGDSPRLVGVEPADAACVTASAAADRLVTVPGPHRSIMVGLNCGTPSRVAWPRVSRGFDAFVDIEDGWAVDAVRSLAGAGIEAGGTGAAALAGLAAWLRSSDRPFALHGSRVLAICTEGASDRREWLRMLGVERLGGEVL
jgi:diaminopropionate ammonia-lyase